MKLTTSFTFNAYVVGNTTDVVVPSTITVGITAFSLAMLIAFIDPESDFIDRIGPLTMPDILNVLLFTTLCMKYVLLVANPPMAFPENLIGLPTTKSIGSYAVSVLSVLFVFVIVHFLS